MSTLQDVLEGVASYINQDPSLPTGTDLTMWINLANQSQDEWANTYDWRKTLTKSYNVSVTNSMTSIGLPADFSRLNSPIFDLSYTGNNRYFEILPQDRFLRDPTDKYFYKMGNNVDGNYIIMNPALSSGASIVIDYIKSPQSLVSYSDVLTCPSAPFITLRTISKILSARSDPRYPTVYQESVTMLQQMMNDEAAPTNARDNQTPTWMDRKQFRIGE